MTDPAHIRALMDRVHDIDYLIEPAPSAPSMDGGGGPDRLMINPRLLKAKQALKANLVSWARLVVDEAGVDYQGADDVLAVAAWLSRHADFLASHPAVDDFENEIDSCLTAILNCVDRGDKKVFVGTFCGQDIYAHRDDATVTLPNGETRMVSTMRDEMRAQTLWATGTAAEVSRILEVMHAVRVSAKGIIAMWREDRRARERGHIGRLEGLDSVDDDPPTFVVNEVLSRVARQERAQKVG